MHGKRQRAPHPAAPRAAGRHLSADLFIGRPHGGLLVPAAVQLRAHFVWALPVTPPQSGSGRKEQIKSKAAKSAAAPRRCTLIRLLKADLIWAVRGSRGGSPSLSLGVPKGEVSSTKRPPPLLYAARCAAVILPPTPPTASSWRPDGGWACPARGISPRSRSSHRRRRSRANRL